jgi:peptide/nickel transport system substrate-binding protein
MKHFVPGKGGGISRRKALTAAGGLGAGVAGLALVGCGDNSSSSNKTATTQPGGSKTAAASATSAPKKGGTLKLGSVSDLLWENMPYEQNPKSTVNRYMVYDNLFRYDTVDLKPTPRLAESYKFNGDQTELSIQLRQGITFHNGQPIDGNAVVAGFNSLTAKDTPTSQVQGLAKAYVDHVTAPDATHATFFLKRPGMLIFDMFHNWPFADAKDIPNLKNGGLPNGSGPFKVTAATPKSGGKMEAFTTFWKAPLLDGVDYKVYPDASSLAIAVQSGAVDFTSDLTIDDAIRFGKQSGFKVQNDKGFSFDECFGMNVKADTLSDPRVRQALYHAMDRSQVVETVFLGQSDPLYSMWPKGTPAYESRYDTDPFDIAKAKQLLSAAGMADGTPEIDVYVQDFDKQSQQILTLYQQTAKKAGINLTAKVTERAVFLPMFLKGTIKGAYHEQFGFNTMHPDSLFVMNFQVRIPNSCNFDTPEYEKFQKDIAAAADESARKTLYASFNKLWDEQMWDFLICNVKTQWLTTSKVGGFTLSDYGTPSMETLSLS